jgi:ribosomal protein L11 methyltransferase
VSWVEVSVTTSGELAEAVVELFTRYAPGAVASEEAAPRSGAAGAEVNVRAYLPDDHSLPALRRRIEEGLWHLSQIAPLPPPQFRPLEALDWTETWKVHYQPIPVGRSLLVLPAWMGPPQGGRVAIRMEPGMAFGTGTHPTTRLCLQAMEDLLRPGHQVLDLGCGSGILAIAAAKLGAARVVALDIDPLAVQAARQNSALNQVQHRVEASRGSLDGLLERDHPARFDLVLANILAPTLQKLLQGGMAKVVRPGGWAVLSGVLDHQVASLVACAQEHGMQMDGELAMQDWRALVMKKPAPEIKDGLGL